jgi:tetratricopeptide (TPR) repeat protein
LQAEEKMPLPVSGPLFGITIALAIGIGAMQSRAPIPVPPGTSGFGDSATGSPYLDLVARYRDSADETVDAADARDKAIAALMALPDGHSVDRALKAFQDLALRRAGDDNPARLSGGRLQMVANAWEQVLPAAAVMHLETAYFLLAANHIDRAVGHLSIARAIVDWRSWALVMRVRPDIGARYATLRRDIYVSIIWILQSFRVHDSLEPHLHRARDEFPDDAMVRLAFGSFEEVRATAVELDVLKQPEGLLRIPRVAWLRAAQKKRWEKAEDYFRDALKADPSLAEAHLRLGRVLRLRGKLKEARQELEAAATAARESAPVPMPAFGPAIVVPYLTEMFLAEVIEEEGGVADALTKYQGIARRWPDCQSGLLALSRAYEARGDREAALNALRPLFREQAKRPCIDPWWAYNLGQGWRFGAFLRSLHLGLKGAP